MRIPLLSPIRSGRDFIRTFAGYDHRAVIASGDSSSNKTGTLCFNDTAGVCSDEYPTVKTRPKRGTVQRTKYSSASAAFVTADVRPADIIDADGVLCYLDGTKIYLGGVPYDLDLSEYGTYKMIRMGAYIIVLEISQSYGCRPFRYINTADVTDKGSVAKSAIYKFGQAGSPETANSRIRIAPCDKDGLAHNAPRASTAPEAPTQGEWWIDISDNERDVLKRYDGEKWVEYQTDFICAYITPGTGCPKFNYLKAGMQADFSVFVTAGSTSPLSDIAGLHDLTAAGNKWVVFEGTVSKCVYIKETDTYPDVATVSMTVSGKVPRMDFVFECGNRLWGCRYGEANNGKTVNEIYASALGDFSVWSQIEGISTDGWTGPCGTNGPWTGAIAFQGYPTFFKEDVMYRVYGSYPAQYQYQQTPCNGVMQGCGDSLAVVNNVLYYKSRAGVCAMSGSLPTEIGTIFGGENYHDAVGGSYRDRYYLSMIKGLQEKHLFVFDTTSGVWYREDGDYIHRFCAVRDDLYAIPSGSLWTTWFPLITLRGEGSTLPGPAQDPAYPSDTTKKITHSRVAETGPVEWYLETGDMGLASPDHKYVSRLTLRMRLGAASHVDIYVSYDDGEWEHAVALDGFRLDSFSLPVAIRRCDHFRLRIAGEGECQIYSLAKTIQGGSEI